MPISEKRFSDLLNQLVVPTDHDPKPYQKTEFDVVNVGSPPPTSFFLINSDRVFTLTVVEVPQDDSRKKIDFLVTKNVAHLLTSEMKVKDYHLYVTTDGVLGLWGTRAEKFIKGSNHWINSALVAKERAKSKWTRTFANRAKGAYEVVSAIGDLGNPKWPDYSDEKILELAFSGHVIDHEDHIVIKKLRGKVL